MHGALLFLLCCYCDTPRSKFYPFFFMNILFLIRVGRVTVCAIEMRNVNILKVDCCCCCCCSCIRASARLFFLVSQILYRAESVIRRFIKHHFSFRSRNCSHDSFHHLQNIRMLQREKSAAVYFQTTLYNPMLHVVVFSAPRPKIRKPVGSFKISTLD